MRRVLAAAVVPVALLVSAVLLVAAFQGHNDDPVDDTPGAVRLVSPLAGQVMLRQDAIYYELEPGWTGGLRVDSLEIPPDQLLRIEGINRVSFTPGPDTETGRLAEGRHCATAVFWRITEARDSAQTFTWCFTAA